MTGDNISDLYDRDFRQGAKNDPKAYAERLGYVDLSDDVEVRTIVNTKEITHITLPEKFILDDMDVSALSAGRVHFKKSTAATLSSTLSTLAGKK